MVKSSIKKTVDQSKYNNYKAVAVNFADGAEIAREYEYWNAAGVLIIHAAIAYSDALTIKYGGVKGQGEDHSAVVTLLKGVIAKSSENKASLLHLEKIIAHKNAVSYNGEIYNSKDINMLWKHFERFRDWAEKLL
jgi:hypothetical protein